MSILLLLLFLCAAVHAQNEETLDSTDTTGTPVTVTVTTETLPPPPPPWWLALIKPSAFAGPIACLVLAWAIGGFIHVQLVRREHALFPVIRGSRAPQTTPLFLSGLLFFLLSVLFGFYEVRSNYELRHGLSGVIDEWLPVHQRAWAAFFICLALAISPWLFARRADTVRLEEA